jgi:hypothetical protein
MKLFNLKKPFASSDSPRPLEQRAEAAGIEATSPRLPALPSSTRPLAFEELALVAGGPEIKNGQ